MRRETAVTVGLGALLAIALVAIAVVVSRQGQPDSVEPGSVQNSAVIRSDSHILGKKGTSKVTFVEFLDFECEACGAFYPTVEQLRKEYAGKVTFVARYFPLPSHFNSTRAARAVESAARQGKFEQMYSMMFTTQKSWAEKKFSQAPLFRTYAQKLGLDMTQYDKDLASKSVADRVQKDVDDGQSLGIQGTPTFYVNGQPLQPQSLGDLKKAIDQALAG